jgi:hypothetical protein
MIDRMMVSPDGEYYAHDGFNSVVYVMSPEEQTEYYNAMRQALIGKGKIKPKPYKRHSVRLRLGVLDGQNESRLPVYKGQFNIVAKEVRK